MIDPDLISRILQFRDDRNWKQFLNPKDLAISISLEAAELLENFQWSGADLVVSKNSEKIAEGRKRNGHFCNDPHAHSYLYQRTA
jgi:NTP pyrophosphatase (non-canonical NTP hydrolase)